jgi:ADP-heptose:LPS heptosyltransferase
MGLPLATSTLQIVDRWIGVPVCLALSIVSKLQRLAGRKAVPASPRKILFVKFAEQGSTVLASPAIRRAVEMAGRENIYFVVFKENRFILDVMGLVPEENVITIEHKGVIDMALNAFSALRIIRGLGIDAAVDLEFFSRSSAALTFLSGARLRAGFHTFFGEGPYRGDLMTHRLLYNPYLHTSQIFEQMVESLGRNPAELPTFGSQPPALNEELPKFIPNPGEIEDVKKILCDLHGRAEGIRLILLNPNASDLIPLRRWRTERYVELARRLLAAYPEVCIAMTGAPDEADSIARIARQAGSDRCFSTAGKTTLRQLLVLYGLSEVLVTNDSGPAHFAALTPINVVTLFGPETPSLFAARTPRNTAIWKGISCSPCVNAYNNRQSPCRNNLCMQQISLDEVFAAVCSAYESRQKALVG